MWYTIYAGSGIYSRHVHIRAHHILPCRIHFRAPRLLSIRSLHVYCCRAHFGGMRFCHIHRHHIHCSGICPHLARFRHACLGGVCLHRRRIRCINLRGWHFCHLRPCPFLCLCDGVLILPCTLSIGELSRRRKNF